MSEAPWIRRARRMFVVPAFAWLVATVALPLGLVAAISLGEATQAAPPFDWALNFTNYALVAGDPLYVEAFARSVRIAATSTAICLAIGYPMALAIARAPRSRRVRLLFLVVLPCWTSFLIRVYAWMGLLRPAGYINSALQALGLIDEPLALIANAFAVHLGIVYAYLPFMVLPLYATIERIDAALVEAAHDLGAAPVRAFWRVTFPLSVPGAIAGALMVFIPACGEFVIPDLLGGPDTQMIGRILWLEFFQNRDWPVACAIATALAGILAGPILLFDRYRIRGT
ncbi:MAG: ABC transporter permease subunit [Alphaproteobacteria bacterium]|nr:ABC transporter permease subunit [Alphaproteobacteria bacterium]